MNFKDKLAKFKTLKRKGQDETCESVKKSCISAPSSSQVPSSSSSAPLPTRDGKRPLVDFLIIGAQKAGTMAAVKNMNKHKDVFVLKECHFFDLYWDMGIDWYRKQLLKNSKGKAIVGEKTPELIYVDECASRIKQVCPNAKFIFFVRDPVKRAFSNWNMQRPEGGTGVEDLSFGDAIDRELKTLMGETRSYGTALMHYVQRGLYMNQITRFLKVFPDRSKLLVVVAEHMRARPAETYQRIFEFIGATPFTFEAEDDHVGSYTKPMHDKTRRKLIEVFQPHNERLFKFLGYEIPEWSSLQPESTEPTEHPPPPVAVAAPASGEVGIATATEEGGNTRSQVS